MRLLLTRTARVVAGGVLALAVTACSDDDGDTAGDATEAPSDDTSATSPATEGTVADSTATGDTSASGGTVAEGDDAACEALRPISEHDAETGPLIEAGDWGEIQSFVVESEAEVVAAYEETAELVPELSDDVLVLRDLTVEYTAAAADAPDLATWVGDVTELATVEHPEAGQAGLDLDAWAVEHCGFSTGGN